MPLPSGLQFSQFSGLESCRLLSKKGECRQSLADSLRWRDQAESLETRMSDRIGKWENASQGRILDIWTGHPWLLNMVLIHYLSKEITQYQRKKHIKRLKSTETSAQANLILSFNLPIRFINGWPLPACQCRRHRRLQLNPWVRKIPWRRAWQPIQYFCLQNPRDRGVWRATVHSVVKSRTQLKWLSTHYL